MLKKTKEVKKEEAVVEKKKKHPLKIVYIKDANKEKFDVTDDTLESRQNAFPVAPSNYAPGTVNYKITTEDISKFKVLKGIARAGDIVDKTEFDRLVT